MKKELVNEFSWSASRAGLFERCARAYYLHYYASWGGWEYNATDEVRTLWRLKKLSGRQAWAGSVVHETIAEVLELISRDRPAPPLAEVSERMHQRMRREFVESREGLWRHRKALGLVEHAYEEDIPAAWWMENWDNAVRCLENFYESPIFEEIQGVPPTDWYPIDALATFDFEGVKIYVAPDFAFRDARDQVRILDWKTGAPWEKDRLQVQGYALFAMRQWNVPLETIQAELHYLSTGQIDVVPVDEDGIQTIQARMRGSIAQMQACLVDPAGNEAVPERLPPVSDARICRFCNFRGVCEDAVLAPAASID